MWILPLCLGLMLGIVINALADSLPLSRKLKRPSCRECAAPRPWYAWSGIVDYLVRRGRCHYCQSTRSWRAPVTEAIATLAALALSNRFGSSLSFWSAVIVTSVFLLILIIDLEHRLILHVVTGPSAVMIALLGVLDPNRGWQKTLLGGLVGLGLVFGLYLMGILFARVMARVKNEPLEEVAFGFGDVTLAGVIGLVVGWPGIIVALVIGILFGGVFSLGYLIVLSLRREYSAFTPIPYSPFLIAGALLVYLGGRSVLANLFH